MNMAPEKQQHLSAGCAALAGAAGDGEVAALWLALG